MDSNLVLGLPPSYIKKTDPTVDAGSVGGMAYKQLWGKIDSKKKSVTNTKLYPVKITIGFPKKTRIGLMDSVLESIKEKDDKNETKGLVEMTNEIIEKQEAKINEGLSTFKFGSAVADDGKNKYLETVNSLMQMLAYGNKVMGVENRNNYFLNRDFTYLSNFEENARYPTITFLASEETTITESSETEMGDSMLKKFVDLGKEVTREFNFISGDKGLNLADVGSFLENVSTKAGMPDYSKEIVSGISAGVNIGEAILGKDITQSWLKGNQVFLPSVWKSSSFSKKYTVQIRLHTSYGNKVAVERNILVPLMYILGFTLPIQRTASGISYPFLVRMDVPGAFNVPMGIVSSLGIKKGGKHDLWSVDTLARSIDITMEVNDLYELLPVPMDRKVGRYAKQTRNFIANMTGMSIPDDTQENKLELETFKAYYEEPVPAMPELSPVGIFDSVPIIGGKLNELTKPYVKAIEDGASKVSSTIDSGIKTVSSGLDKGINTVSSTVSDMF